MILGMSTAMYTLVHVVISLLGIASGLVVAIGMLDDRRLDAWTALFLLTTIATSATGFGFPFDHLLPSHIVGIISLVVLGVAVVARYGYGLGGAWRVVYVVTAMIALYLNVFVLVVQSFLKIAPLHALAPTQTEAPFQIAQLAVLITFVVLTIAAARRFR
jgi:hypothetical protein